MIFNGLELDRSLFDIEGNYDHIYASFNGGVCVITKYKVKDINGKMMPLCNWVIDVELTRTREMKLRLILNE